MLVECGVWREAAAAAARAAQASSRRPSEDCACTEGPSSRVWWEVPELSASLSNMAGKLSKAGQLKDKKNRGKKKTVAMGTGQQREALTHPRALLLPQLLLDVR